MAEAVLGVVLTHWGLSWVLWFLGAELWDSQGYCQCTGVQRQILGPLGNKVVSQGGSGLRQSKAASLLVWGGLCP